MRQIPVNTPPLALATLAGMLQGQALQNPGEAFELIQTWPQPRKTQTVLVLPQ